MSLAVPGASQGEPEVTVPVSVIGDAAELLALVAELIDTAPGTRGQVEALMGRKGAEPGPAADWMIASVSALARRAEEILAYEGIACDRGLARYWRRPGTRRQGG
ncbi:MAG TPA: hypothetical protein VHZ03_37795 [Trebonia sp.]|jgi:hypothetical protein|nr:hypothetical protein [Trebonia sp.]